MKSCAHEINDKMLSAMKEMNQTEYFVEVMMLFKVKVSF